MRENYKRSASERVGILACAVVRVKKVDVFESCEIARVAYLGQITNIRSGRVQKLYKERSREDKDITMSNWAREKSCRIKIARNRTGSIFRPNNEY